MSQIKEKIGICGVCGARVVLKANPNKKSGYAEHLNWILTPHGVTNSFSNVGGLPRANTQICSGTGTCPIELYEPSGEGLKIVDRGPVG